MKSYVLLFIAAVITFMAGSAFGEYGGGTGEPNDPYLIQTADHLVTLQQTSSDWNKCFTLISNVICNSPSAQIGDSGTSFTGVFDGNNFTILNFPGGYGLFGILGSKAQVRNLNLIIDFYECNDSQGGLVWNNNGGVITNCTVTGSLSVDNHGLGLGGLAGCNSGTIDRCSFNGSVSTKNRYIQYPGGIGGLVGINNGIVINSHFSGAVITQTNCVGGLVGWNSDNATISGSDVAGTVLGYSQIGGLIGYNKSSSITDCSFHGSVNSKLVDYGPIGNTIGGLIGANGEYSTSGGAVTNCYTGGSVSGGDYVGGLIGQNYGGAVQNCNSNSTIHGGHYLGGLMGSHESGTGAKIENCYATGDVFSERVALRDGGYVGGLVGASQGDEIINSYATGNVHGENRDYIGGLVGYSYCGILNCHASGTVSGYLSVGGLVGSDGGWSSQVGAIIENCYATGAITGSDQIGGLVGENYGKIIRCKAEGLVHGTTWVGGLVGIDMVFASGVTGIRESFCTGAVSGDYGIGGLIGFSWGGTISDSYATGAVSGRDMVGGLAAASGPGPIINCYAIGHISADSNSGGLIAYYGGATVTNSFWDTETTGQVVSAGGTGKTTVEMKQQVTFASWNFVNVWQINEGVDYPNLISSPLPPPCNTPIPGDLNNDCKVDFSDFAIMASHWLESD